MFDSRASISLKFTQYLPILLSAVSVDVNFSVMNFQFGFSVMKIFFAFALMSLTISISDSFAQEGWISLGQMKAAEKTLRANGQRMSGIACRKNGNKSEFLFKGSKNRGNKEWVWAYGHSILDKNLQLRKQGYRMHSSHSNDYKGRIRCGIWYK